MALISVLMPVFDEEEYVVAALRRVLCAPLPEGWTSEVVVVDDGSTDGSAEAVAAEAARDPERIRVFRHPRNRGKGAALRTAIEQARGEICIVQDADLEYDPRDYPKLLGPLVEGVADIVYGSRFLVSGERRVLYFWHALANHALNTVCNVIADLNLTDMGTCYKAFSTSLVRSVPLRSNGFGFEAELTIKLARRGLRIYETPVRYHGRTYEEGKKLRRRDGLAVLLTAIRYAFTRDIYADPGGAVLHALSAAPRFNRWMADTIRPWLGERVLEIGAGIGNLTRLLAPRRRHYLASDIDAERIARLRSLFQHRPNLEVRQIDLANPADFATLEESLDTIVCLNVLEHVEREGAALANLHTALVPGGRAIVLVPHGQSAYGTLDEALGHVRRYSREQLRAAMERAGFGVECLIDFNHVSWPGWWISGKLLRRHSIGSGSLALFDRTVWFWRMVDRLLPWPPVSIIAIGVKR